jgi:hypothetical protein
VSQRNVANSILFDRLVGAARSYVKWLTCLEMEWDVRKIERQPQSGAGPWTLPKVSPAINSAGR